MDEPLNPSDAFAASNPGVDAEMEGVGDSPLFTEAETYSERQERYVLIGGTAVTIGIAIHGIDFYFGNSNFGNKSLLIGLSFLVAGLLETCGFMAIACCDIDYDMVAKRYQARVLVFSFVWAVIYKGLNVLSPPVSAVTQAFWLPALPSFYLLIFHRSILNMENEVRFSDLFGYTMGLDLLASGYGFFFNSTGHMEAFFCGLIYVLSGLYLISTYRHFRELESRRIALSTTIFGYLITIGVSSLTALMFDRYVYHFDHAGRQIPENSFSVFIGYIYSVIHILFPAVLHSYQSMQPKVAVELQTHGVLGLGGGIAAVQRTIRSGVDLNAHINSREVADAVTILTLACSNGHEDAVDLLLRQDSVQVNKGSLRQNWTPLYMASMQGHLSIVKKLIAKGADVHSQMENGDNALNVATAKRHSHVIVELARAGARTPKEGGGGVA
jgi:hypothetical protein